MPERFHCALERDFRIILARSPESRLRFLYHIEENSLLTYLLLISTEVKRTRMNFVALR